MLPTVQPLPANNAGGKLPSGECFRHGKRRRHGRVRAAGVHREKRGYGSPCIARSRRHRDKRRTCLQPTHQPRHARSRPMPSSPTFRNPFRLGAHRKARLPTGVPARSPPPLRQRCLPSPAPTTCRPQAQETGRRRHAGRRLLAVAGGAAHVSLRSSLVFPVDLRTWTCARAPERAQCMWAVHEELICQYFRLHVPHTGKPHSGKYQ